MSISTTAAVPFAGALADHGDRPAILTAGQTITYGELAERVDATAQRLGPHRRLVLLAGSNTVDAVVTYLAALAAGHPVLLVPGGQDDVVRWLVDAYDPDVIAHTQGSEWVLDERRDVSSHTLHPDLALLLSTSGSTGSPKLVRLSRENLQANAESIATYLEIRHTDRAATTLPMHYCYGLSVINSHLLRGAALLLTDLSVADAEFWRLFADGQGSSFAGVPYTFDLLDRVGFAEMDLPSLRYVTQAGGRLARDRVAGYADLGRVKGWDLFVMYGQTEATARMAYLPPDLASVRPGAIGVPVPGGSFRLRPLPDWPDTDTGELVYTGPNVMLGYADRPADLGLGRSIDELPTGDVARHGADGLYEIVGRRSGFAKILGLRIDPHRVEEALAADGVTALCLGNDDELFVAVAAGTVGAAHVRRRIADEYRLPVRVVRVLELPDLPRLPSGKADYQAMRDLCATTTRPTPAIAVSSVDSAALCRLYAEVLDRADVTDEESFVSLGGDSLSYVEMAVRLEQALGKLEPNWHALPIRTLASVVAPPPTRTRRVETSIALRAAAIVLIVGTHAQAFAISGGAHLLLAVAGFNLGRFHLSDADRSDRVTSIGTSIRRIAVPSVAWIGLAYLLTDDYSVAQVFLGNYIVGPPGQHNHYWFIEALLYILIFVCAAIWLLDRVERRFPFGLPMALMLVGLIGRYQLVPSVDLRAPAVVFWLVALGWAAAKATKVWHRVLLTIAVVATVPGFFGDLPREAVIVAGLVLLLWIPTLPSLGALNRIAAVLAGSSLYIYLTHWQVFPLFDQYSALLALVASLAAGLAYGEIHTRLGRRLGRWVGRGSVGRLRQRAR